MMGRHSIQAEGSSPLVRVKDLKRCMLNGWEARCLHPNGEARRFRGYLAGLPHGFSCSPSSDPRKQGGSKNDHDETTKAQDLIRRFIHQPGGKHTDLLSSGKQEIQPLGQGNQAQYEDKPEDLAPGRTDSHQNTKDERDQAKKMGVFMAQNPFHPCSSPVCVQDDKGPENNKQHALPIKKPDHRHTPIVVRYNDAHPESETPRGKPWGILLRVC
jgi:hypothetical protein